MLLLAAIAVSPDDIGKLPAAGLARLRPEEGHHLPASAGHPRCWRSTAGRCSCRSSTSRDLAEIEAGAEVLGELRLVEQEEPVA